MSRWLRTLAFSLLFLTAGVAFWGSYHFLAQNNAWVILKIPFIQWDLNDPFPNLEYDAYLWLVMVVAFFVGALFAGLLFFPSWIRRGVERRRQRRYIHDLEGELADLRNLPVNSPAPLEDEPPQGQEKRQSVDPLQEEEEERALMRAALGDTAERPGR